MNNRRITVELSHDEIVVLHDIVQVIRSVRDREWCIAMQNARAISVIPSDVLDCVLPATAAKLDAAHRAICP